MKRLRNLFMLLFKELIKHLPSLEEKYGERGKFLDALFATTAMTVGLTLMATGVAIGVATILDDLLTGGAGVADDPLTFSVALELFWNGLDISLAALVLWGAIIGNKDDKDSSATNDDRGE